MSDSFGTIDPQRLGSGDPDQNKVLHGDSVWRVLEVATPTGATPLVYAQTSVAGGDTIASTAAATIFASKYAMPANTLDTAGMLLRVRARGTMRNNNANVGVTWEVIIGTTAIASNTVDTGNYSANTTVRGWTLDADLILTTAGATAVIEGGGSVRAQTAGAAASEWQLTDQAGTVNLTAAQDVAIRFTWGTSAANNTITMRQLVIELLGP